jgi:probable phosphoglycerate mutase
MATKQLYIIRHGETAFNHQGLVQGSGVDSDLNDTGRAQAAAFYKRFGTVAFDRVYTSALKRTWQSVEQFTAAGLPWERHTGLNEISWGHSEGKPTNSATDHIYYDTILAWNKGDLDRSMPGGESPRAVAARQAPVIELWHTRTDEETILVCMHGRAMRILLCQLLGMPLTEMETFMHHNLCLYLLELDTETGRCVVKLANERVWRG